MRNDDQQPPITVGNSHATQGIDGNEFHLLKSWHLATLREHATELPQNLTPAALINADKQQIERLIISGAQAAPQTGSFTSPARKAGILWSFASSLGAAFLAAYFRSQAEHYSSFSTMAVLSSLISLVATGIGCALTYKCLKVLDAVGSSLSTVTSKDLNSYDKLPAIAAKVVQEWNEHVGGETVIVEVSADLWGCFDSNGRVRAANKGAMRILGRQAEELIGCDLVALILADDRQGFHNALKRAQDGQRITHLEMRVLSKYKQAVDLRFSISWSAKNKLFFAQGQDITSEKTLERARIEFVSTMAHDIKIPLTSVLLGLQFLVESSELFDAKQEQTVVRAESNLERLIGLIDELLEYERSTQSGEMPLRYSSVSLCEMIDDALDAVASQAEKKQIKLTKIATDVIIAADEGKLQRVIVNLLSNAVKFSPANTEVILKAELQANTVEIHVSDSGPGIPEDYRQLIFERYERLPISEEIEGTGLGLSICRAIIEAHGGLIGVSGSATGGSDFWFNLPIKPDQERANAVILT